jgi:hypothetical protein
MDSTQKLTPEEHHQLLCQTPVKDKNTALYFLYCFLKRAAQANVLSSDELSKLNLCVDKFPGLEKVGV